ncbi:MAG TPA: hypothetical protein VFI08_13605, partial [Spirochaetia bacterium]|nr:hypothetical protein [Spirochaetia bacterium]
SVDPAGTVSLTLRDGSTARGTLYRNWRGFVGDGQQGETRLSAQKLPARVSFVEPGTLFAMGLSITGSLEENMESPYGQRDYLDWKLHLSIENPGSSTVKFGRDIMLLDCTSAGLFDGAYVSYAPGAPARKPEVTDFDPESHAYSLANFEQWWGDGTLRAYRNGGTYVMADPPDHTAEPTICNTSLSAGASTRMVKEFTQGSYVDPHTRVLVVLPAVSAAGGKARIVLGFRKKAGSDGSWVLDSSKTIRLTRDELLSYVNADESDPPLSVLALHWLADVDPSAVAPILDRNICAATAGLPLVASIQLLANSHLQPSQEELASLQTLARDGDDWASRAAKRYLDSRK